MNDRIARNEPDTLKKLMQALPREEPDPDYVQRVMNRVLSDNARRETRRDRWLLLWPFAGLLVFLVAFVLFGIYAPRFGFTLPKLSGDQLNFGSIMHDGLEMFRKVSDRMHTMGEMLAPWTGIMAVVLFLLFCDHIMRRIYSHRNR